MPKVTISHTLPALALVAALAAPLGAAQAHCDRVNGPVAQAAEHALETGEFSEVAIWVGEEQAPELRQVFERSLAVYRGGGEAGDLARDYFFSNAVRLHRLSEGMSFEGLKPPRPVSEDIAVAERSLDESAPDAVVDYLSDKVERKVRDLHDQAIEAAKRKDESIEAGRDWADAYVRYIVFVHGLVGTIEAGPEHGVGG